MLPFYLSQGKSASLHKPSVLIKEAYKSFKSNALRCSLRRRRDLILTAGFTLFLLAVAGGRLGAEALCRVRAPLSRCVARFVGVSVCVRSLRCRRRAALRAPVGRVEELVERLR